MDKGKAAFLVLVVDIDSLVSSALSKAVNGALESTSNVIESVLKSLAVFCNCYALMHRQNELSVVGVLSGSVRVIFPVSNATNAGELNYLPLLHSLTDDITNGLREAAVAQISIHGTRDIESRGFMSQALSNALCMMNRRKQLQSRLLIIQFEKDRNQNYNALMNSIFRCVCHFSGLQTLKTLC